MNYEHQTNWLSSDSSGGDLTGACGQPRRQPRHRYHRTFSQGYRRVRLRRLEEGAAVEVVPTTEGTVSAHPLPSSLASYCISWIGIQIAGLYTCLGLMARTAGLILL